MAKLDLTVLGRYGTFPAEGGACSGYFIQAGSRRFLLDCGNGVLSRMQKYCRLDALDGIIISHLHDDHCGDLRILKYVIETKRAFQELDRPVRLFIPASPVETVQELNDPSAYDITFINEDVILDFDDLKIEFAAMKHSIESYAVSIKIAKSHLVYSGDTLFNETLIAFAQDADLLLCESTFSHCDQRTNKAPHMTAGEAGHIAMEAGVKKLLLTHYWFEEDIRSCLAEARQYHSSVIAAEEMKSYSI